MEECVPSTTYRFQAASDRIVSVTLAADSIVTPVELALSRHILSWMFNGKTSLRGCRVLQLMSSSGSLVGLVAARLGGEVTIFAPAQPPSLLWNIEQNSSLTQCCCDGSSSLPSSELCAKSGLVKLVSDLSSGIATPFDVVLACYGDEHWNSVSSSAMVCFIVDFVAGSSDLLRMLCLESDSAQVSWLIAVTHPGSHVFLAAASGSMGICGFLETIGSVFTVKSTASSGVTLFMLTRATDDGKPCVVVEWNLCQCVCDLFWRCGIWFQGDAVPINCLHTNVSLYSGAHSASDASSHPTCLPAHAYTPFQPRGCDSGAEVSHRSR